MKTQALLSYLKDHDSGVYVQFEMKTVDDDNQMRPDTNDEGFWPSRNPEAAGYIGDNPTTDYETQLANAEKRMKAWREDEWRYVGVYAVAKIYDYRLNSHITEYTLQSSGIWGIESDSNESLIEAFGEQCDELKDLLERFNSIRYIV